MPDRIIDADATDSIRITMSDGQRVQIPAAAVLAVDVVLRDIAGDPEAWLRVRCEFMADGKRVWTAKKNDGTGYGATPWAAVVDLAKKLEEQK